MDDLTKCHVLVMGGIVLHVPGSHIVDGTYENTERHISQACLMRKYIIKGSFSTILLELCWTNGAHRFCTFLGEQKLESTRRRRSTRLQIIDL